ncbi:MAG TPA: universal stress protein, partial [Candidatus Sulfotelmatobacter sp.]|nr:universal stress protein [Candidatus Sulfotelmatobacter sp.]
MVARIIVGLDGSEASRAAASLAGWVATRTGGRVRLVSVVEEPPPYVSARREEQAERATAEAFFGGILRAQTSRLQRRGLVADSTVLHGNEAAALLEAAAVFGAEMIAVGHAGHSGVWASGLGATAGRVAQAATTSVLVARSGTADISRVVVGYDGSPDAVRAMALAAGLSERDGVSVVVAASADLVAAQDPRWAIEAVRRRVGAGASWRTEVLVGDPAIGLVHLAADGAHDLLCIGAHGQRHPWAPALGPVAHSVLERAAGSVLIVRSPAGALTAGRLMRAHPVSVRPDTPVGEAARTLLELGVKCLPVVDPEGRPVGILTLGDLLRRAGFGVRHSLAPALSDAELHSQLAQLLAAGTACEMVMTRDVATATRATPVSGLLQEVGRRRIKRLLVIDGEGRLVGIVSRSDILRALAGAAEGSDVMLRRAVSGTVA